MNEERVLALAGVFQAVSLVHQLANDGRCDDVALEASLRSVFRIDAPDVAGVFDGVPGVRLGLRTLISELDGDRQRDMTRMRMAVTVLRLERSLAGRADMLEKLHEGILATQRQVDHFGLMHATVAGRLAELYVSTLSTLRPRVLVSGAPLQLQQQPVVERIRAALLAAVRAAVLWRQIGGRQWQLLIKRRQCAMLARGMLTGATIDNG
ncbi:high frequency lysogenization protein HflD [Oleiagrimonas sp. C23AA]|uniref:high frequency lysogenization protein HflD n=1 Tax=Oleiagrimonas sp. C23AA TaxID=2719047 RepID=UPI0014216046|nr:high frequency lysogenization protein HflD [Oleiagrimonas sp. C23AA]NII10360.1 high frequency lysogenization protein HflD [Oleiagrimonas sp. C23AA]